MVTNTLYVAPSAANGLTLSTPASAWGYSSYSTAYTGAADVKLTVYGFVYMYTSTSNIANGTTHEMLWEIQNAPAIATAVTVAQVPITVAAVSNNVEYLQVQPVILPYAVEVASNAGDYPVLQVRVADSDTQACSYAGVKLLYFER